MLLKFTAVILCIKLKTEQHESLHSTQPRQQQKIYHIFTIFHQPISGKLKSNWCSNENKHPLLKNLWEEFKIQNQWALRDSCRHFPTSQITHTVHKMWAIIP